MRTSIGSSRPGSVKIILSRSSPRRRVHDHQLHRQHHEASSRGWRFRRMPGPVEISGANSVLSISSNYATRPHWRFVLGFVDRARRCGHYADDPDRRLKYFLPLAWAGERVVDPRLRLRPPRIDGAEVAVMDPDEGCGSTPRLEGCEHERLVLFRRRGGRVVLRKEISSATSRSPPSPRRRAHRSYGRVHRDPSRLASLPKAAPRSRLQRRNCLPPQRRDQ